MSVSFISSSSSRILKSGVQLVGSRAHCIGGRWQRVHCTVSCYSVLRNPVGGVSLYHTPLDPPLDIRYQIKQVQIKYFSAEELLSLNDLMVKVQYSNII